MLQFILHSHPAAPQPQLHTIHHNKRGGLAMGDSLTLVAQMLNLTAKLA